MVRSSPAEVSPSSRGPPRKPKQSGYALWVGNIPPTASLVELKDHFATGLANDIESLLFIAKSSCAFVNYRTQESCAAALARFHRSLFRGNHLVCRIRRSPEGTTSQQLSPNPESEAVDKQLAHVRLADETDVSRDEHSGPVIVGGSPLVPEEHDAEAPKSAEKFFILKSLTVGDLEASLRDGTWSTQPHNEEILSQAYEECQNVYLIFSANKSGEYFGFARMASPFSTKEEVKDISDGPPSSTLSPASQTAPRGRIVDDPSRGTLFWEADPVDENEKAPKEDEPRTNKPLDGERSFAIQWLSTKKVPFHLTRGLRNSYKYVFPTPVS